VVSLRYPVFKDSDYYYLPLEFCNGGTLSELIKIRGRLTEFEAQVVLR
jgi:serine/threonine protein kinase